MFIPEDLRVPVADLRHACDPAEFPFETTAEIEPSEDVIGQDRAVRAIEFGLSIKNHGFNLYIAGIPGTGKNSIVKTIVARIAKERPVPEDWCYINNFRDPDRPRAIKLPAGMARSFQQDVEKFIELMMTEIPKIFESKEYEEEKAAVLEGLEKAKEALFSEAGRRAQALGFQLTITRTGIVKIPFYKGKPLEPQDIEQLTLEERRDMEEREKKVDAEIRDFLSKARQLDKEAHDKIHDINRRVAHFAMGHRIEDLKEKYGRQNLRIPDYLAEVEEDILNNLREFLGQTQEQPFPGGGTDRASFLDRYKVNVVVDNSKTRGGPVVEEVNPTYNNLVGRIERRAKFGVFYTNFTMIKSGSVLQANGGYLLLNALDVLRNPFSWDALKRIIKKSEVKIEDIAEIYGFATGGLKPEPIPVSLKVIMLGSPWLYYLLFAYDEDFREIFKVKADFDTQTADGPDEKMRYARFISRIVKIDGLLPFGREAVAEIVDYAVRLAEKKGKLTLRFSDLADLVRESSYWAARDGSSIVERRHIERALDEKIYRSNLIEDRIQELIVEGTLMVDVAGMVVGQVNGLSVYDLGDFSFGKPSRITARCYLGRSGVVDIEREAKLSGRIYNKGVLIMSGYLGGKYAQDRPLSLSASLAFEQSYGEVDGDSASAAELIAVLSAIADVPLKQGIAITGSINQKGELQPIGGVNEKIEGFFAVCKKMGLNGSQGVVIPRANVKNLMLKKEVVEAVKEGKFCVYAASTVEEAMEILTGLQAGKRQADGTYPEGSLNYLVERKLKEMALKQKAEEKEKKEENNENSRGKT